MCDALVSIHDVMPETMQETRELLELCADRGVKHTTLLVVPGLPWTAAMLEQLHSWQENGHEIAAHGWVHQCGRISTWYHRGHSLLISRQAAEHLSKDESQVLELMQQTADWFKVHFDSIPELYVPPAWALGRISMSGLRETPFRYVETLTSVLDVRTARYRSFPLVGFEADTMLRQSALQLSNAINTGILGRNVRTMRIAIHPFDHRLRMARSLANTFARFREFHLYRDLLN